MKSTVFKGLEGRNQARDCQRGGKGTTVYSITVQHGITVKILQESYVKPCKSARGSIQQKQIWLKKQFSLLSESENNAGIPLVSGTPIHHSRRAVWCYDFALERIAMQVWTFWTSILTYFDDVERSTLWISWRNLSRFWRECHNAKDGTCAHHRRMLHCTPSRPVVSALLTPPQNDLKYNSNSQGSRVVCQTCNCMQIICKGSNYLERNKNLARLQKFYDICAQRLATRKNTAKHLKRDWCNLTKHLPLAKNAVFGWPGTTALPGKPPYMSLCIFFLLFWLAFFACLLVCLFDRLVG
jgi:hypothetical protein